MKIKAAILFLVFLLTIGGLSALYLLSADTETDKKAQVSFVSEVEPSQAQGQQTQNAQTQSTGGLQVQGGSQAQSQPSLPQPDQFDVYEQYANEQSSLFADVVLGDGQEAVAGDSVSIVYSGYLTNGQLFDESRTNENNQIEAFTFTIGSGQVIPGWDQTITGMKVGGQRRLIIPSQFGYGPNGQGTIPPNAMLIFDVQLVAINGE